MPLVWNGTTWVPGGSSPKKKKTAPVGVGSRRSRDPEVEVLKRQNDAMKVNVERLGGKVDKGGPSIMSRIFDVLSRGNYAVAEGVRRVGALESPLNNPASLNPLKIAGAAASGAAAGASGKAKTSFSQVLKEEGVAGGKLGAAAGLVLDIGLDPTTYVGVGLPGKAARAVKLTAEVNKSKTFTKAIGSKTADKLAAHAVVDAVTAKAGTGRKVNTSKVAVEAKTRYALEAAKEAEDATLRNNVNKVSLKVLGKPVVGSEKLYRGVARVGDAIAKTPTGQILNKAFRTASYFPGDTNRLRRMYESQGVANWENMVKTDIKPLFKGLSKDERVLISHAIERGDDLTGTIGKNGQDLGLLQKQSKAMLDDIYDEEAHVLGLFDDGLPLTGVPETDFVLRDSKRNSKYVYHFYKSRKGDEYKKFKNSRKAVASEVHGPAQARKIPTLDEAKKAGLNPVEAIDDILSLRFAKSHQIRARKSFVNAIEKEYGVRLTSKQAKHMPNLEKGSSKFLSGKDVYFPKDVAKVLGTVETFYDNDDVAKAAMNLFDRAQGFWKFGATAVNPGHHVRNFIGDVFLNYEDGVVNPARYYQSLKVMSKAPNYKVRVGKMNLTPDEILREFRFTGAKSGFYKSEFGDKSYNKIGQAIRTGSETREDFGRLAHFIDAVKKEGKGVKNIQQLREAAEKASARVNKFNIDYGDLTPTERKYMRRAIPFYTFIRKNIPLQLETLALNPGRLAVVPKTQQTIERMLGTEQSEIGMVVPKWIREMGAINIRGEGEGNNALYWAPALPVGDVSRFIEGGPEEILRGVGASATPAFRIPAELMAGKKFFSGAPINSYTQYASEQLPASRVATSSINPENRSMQKIFNYLTGAGVYENTPQLQKSELRRQQQPLKTTIKKARQKRESR